MNNKKLNTLENLKQPDNNSLSVVEAKVMRLQRTRKKGYTKPENSIYVGRPSKWGNPYKVVYNEIFFYHPYHKEWLAIGSYYNNKIAIENMMRRYQDKILTNKFIKEVRQELKGKNLLCWCKIGEPCHADILLKVVNV